MKIAFTTLACPDWNFAKILDEAQRLGYQGIEIRGLDNEMRADRMPMFSAENAAATKGILKEKGIKIAGFGSSVKFHNDAEYAASIQEGRLAVDVCERMDIPGLRVFGDNLPAVAGAGVGNGDGSGGDGSRARVLKQICTGLRTLCEYARGKGIGIWLEIHGDFNTLDNILPIVDGVKDLPEFGILWDIGNSDASYGGNWREFYAGIKPYVRHVHIKDHTRTGNVFTYCQPGEGETPLADIIKTLRREGYDGWYSFEWEKKWHPEIAGPEVVLPGYIEFMKKLLV